MRSVFAFIVVLCFLGAVSADCLPRLDSSFFDDNSGNTNIESVQGANNLPLTGVDARCQGVLGQFVGQTICCSSATLDRIVTVANNIDTAVTQAENAFNSAVSQIDIIGPNSQLTQEEQNQINSVPKLKAAVGDIDAACDRFRGNAPGHFSQCLRTVETYVAGALCSICRPDFIPEVLSIDNSTGVVHRTWKWRETTCDKLSSGCSPLLNDFDNLLTTLWDVLNNLFSDPQIKQAMNGDEFSTLFPTRDDIRLCVIVARAVDGSNTNIATACRTAVCKGMVSGLRRPELFDGSEFSALSIFGKKRNNGNANLAAVVKGITDFAREFTESFGPHASLKRQTASSDTNSFGATFKADAYAAGQGSTVGNLETTASASALSLSIAALVAIVALTMF